MTANDNEFTVILPLLVQMRTTSNNSGEEAGVKFSEIVLQIKTTDKKTRGSVFALTLKAQQNSMKKER